MKAPQNHQSYLVRPEIQHDAPPSISLNLNPNLPPSLWLRRRPKTVHFHERSNHHPGPPSWRAAGRGKPNCHFFLIRCRVRTVLLSPQHPSSPPAALSRTSTRQPAAVLQAASISRGGHGLGGRGGRGGGLGRRAYLSVRTDEGEGEEEEKDRMDVVDVRRRRRDGGREDLLM